MRVLLTLLFLLSFAQAQTYISPFTFGQPGGSLLKVGATVDTVATSTNRLQSYRLQGRFETWISINPNTAYWRDTSTGKLDSLQNNYLEGHAFVVTDTGFIFMFLEPIDSVVNFRVEWRDTNMNVTGLWRSYDNLAPWETDSAIVADVYPPYWNAWHPNWITENGLLSCRHTNTVYWIRPDGTTRRRIKGPFRAQHAAHFIAPNRILLFDNLGLDTASRALVVDTFGLVVEEINPGNRVGEIMGNAQRLSNGNTLICWGGSFGPRSYPEIEEYDPFGAVVWSFNLPGNEWTYQAWRRDGAPLMLNRDKEKVIPDKPQKVDLLGRLR